MSAPVGWGVIPTTSMVAQKAVLPALAASPDAQLIAVASRSEAPNTFGARRVYDSYHLVLDDPEVEVVYLALPNHLHAEWTERAAAAGKHVLCEKPLARTAAEAAEMANVCERAGVVLAEAYMTPFHPRSEMVEDLLRSGRLGPLQSAHVAFTGAIGRPDNHRWQPGTGGGALLDLGVYVVAPLLVAAARPPQLIAATVQVTDAPVDAWCNAWLDFGEGFAAATECSFEAPERQVLEVVGTDAALLVTRSFTPGPDDTDIRWRARGGVSETLRTAGGDPYRNMVDHISAVVRDGVALRRPPSDSIAVLDVLDRIRAAAGLE